MPGYDYGADFVPSAKTGPAAYAVTNSSKVDPEGFGNWLNQISGKTSAQRFEAEQAAIANEASSREAQIQREHELYMSNTAYQRAVEDMKAAGINPASLTGVVGQGQPAAASSSSAASQHKASDASGTQVLSALIGLIGLVAGAGIRGAISKSVANMPRKSLSRAFVYSKKL